MKAREVMKVEKVKGPKVKDQKVKEISLSGQTEAASLLFPLHQMLISSLNYAWNKLRGEPANSDSYRVGGMRLRLPKLQAEDQEARKVRTSRPGKCGVNKA